MKRAEILEEARRFVTLQTPFRPHGKTERGLDCGGVPAMIAYKFGIPFEDYKGRVNQPDSIEMIRLLKKNLIRADQTRLKPGMVIVMHDGFGKAMHLGILGERGGKLTVIHIAVSTRFCIEEQFEPHLKKKFYMAFEFPGVED